MTIGMKGFAGVLVLTLLLFQAGCTAGPGKEPAVSGSSVSSKTADELKLSFPNDKTINDGDLTEKELGEQLAANRDLWQQLWKEAGTAKTYDDFQGLDQKARTTYAQLLSAGKLNRLRTPEALFQAFIKKADSENPNQSFAKRVAVFQKEYPVAAKELGEVFTTTAASLAASEKITQPTPETSAKIMKDLKAAYREAHPEDVYDRVNINAETEVVFYRDGSLRLIKR